jgi:hypothetical protein
MARDTNGLDIHVVFSVIAEMVIVFVTLTGDTDVPAIGARNRIRARKLTPCHSLINEMAGLLLVSRNARLLRRPVRTA